MEAVKLVGVGVVAGILAVTIKKTNPELALQVSLGTGILIFLMCMGYLRQAVDFVNNFALQYAAVYEGITIVLKIVGIAYICEFAVQVLKDAGENAIATKVELGGKLIIIVVTLPLLTGFAELALSLIPR